MWSEEGFVETKKEYNQKKVQERDDEMFNAFGLNSPCTIHEMYLPFMSVKKGGSEVGDELERPRCPVCGRPHSAPSHVYVHVVVVLPRQMGPFPHPHLVGADRTPGTQY